MPGPNAGRAKITAFASLAANGAVVSIRFPGSADLRPTPDRVRETLFNWLGQDLTGEKCLDLFAGSGALGFEAASRGARQVVMVERDAQVFRALQATHTMLAAAQVELRREPMHWRFCDPMCAATTWCSWIRPIHLDLLPRLLPLLPQPP